MKKDKTGKNKIFVYGLDELLAKLDGKIDNDLWRIEHYFPEYALRVKNPKEADLILVVGGDGTMLKAIRQLRKFNKPFCGLNFGHLGFLMNEPGHATATLNDICDNELEIVSVNLLEISAISPTGKAKTYYAFNDFYIERTKPQTAKIRIAIDGVNRFDPLTCDGVIVATTAGSTSYTAAAGGVVAPIGIDGLILTGICPAVFEDWRSCLLPPKSVIELEPTERDKRSVRFIADGQKLPDCQKVLVKLSDQKVQLAFLLAQNFHTKVMDLQFHNLKKGGQ